MTLTIQTNRKLLPPDQMDIKLLKERNPCPYTFSYCAYILVPIMFGHFAVAGRFAECLWLCCYVIVCGGWGCMCVGGWVWCRCLFCPYCLCVIII